MVQFETADRARRTRDRVSGTRQYDGGPVVFLDQAGSNDPDHALVPARMKQDGGFSGAKNRVAIDHGKSLTGNITIVFPPEIILRVDQFTFFNHQIWFEGCEQTNSVPAIVHADVGVDAGANTKHDTPEPEGVFRHKK